MADPVGEKGSLKYLDGHKKLNTETRPFVGVYGLQLIYCLHISLHIENLELPTAVLRRC
jgi:hypothetical protein